MVAYVTVLDAGPLNPGGSNRISMPAYTGPVAEITNQYIARITTDSLNIATSVPNVFLKGSAGPDAISVARGRNVLDGGTSSNFLSGGTGQDTFFVDGRGGGITWSTIANFRSGDDATIWGWQDGVSKLTWAENEGAFGFTGATLHIDLRGTGTTDASMTFAGYSVAKATAFLQQSGGAPGATYLHFVAT